MSEKMRPKFLVVGFDGLRPDLIDPQLMPHLSAFLGDAFRFSRARGVFPTETYPNVSAILTGATPEQHGVVANRFHVPDVDTKNYWYGGDIDIVERHIEALGGRFHTVPTIGDILGEAGLRFWTINTGTAGVARLMNPSVKRFRDHLCLIVKNVPRSLPSGIAHELGQLGIAPPPGAAEGENLAEQTYATDAFLALAQSRGLPDVAFLWYAGTDHAMHEFGLAGAKSQAMVRHVDEQFGRVVAWWQSHAAHERLQIIVCSDHGHVTQTRRVDMTDVLTQAGFKCGPRLEGDADVVHLAMGGGGNIRVRDSRPDLLDAVCRTLMQHPATGLLFTRGRTDVEGIVQGTFAQSLAGLAHPTRSSDIDYSLGGDNARDASGFEGTCWTGNLKPLGASNHGGFHRKLLETLLAFRGALFQAGGSSSLPARGTDITPTILHHLGLDRGVGVGRILLEASSGAPANADPVEQRWTAEGSGYAQELIADVYAGRRYFREGLRRM